MFYISCGTSSAHSYQVWPGDDVMRAAKRHSPKDRTEWHHSQIITYIILQKQDVLYNLKYFCVPACDRSLQAEPVLVRSSTSWNSFPTADLTRFSLRSWRVRKFSLTVRTVKWSNAKICVLCDGWKCGEIRSRQWGPTQPRASCFSPRCPTNLRDRTGTERRCLPADPGADARGSVWKKLQRLNVDPCRCAPNFPYWSTATAHKFASFSLFAFFLSSLSLPSLIHSLTWTPSRCNGSGCGPGGRGLCW